MTEDRADATGTGSHNWIYTARKGHLIDFLIEHSTREVYDLFTIDDLRKVIVKWYARKEKEDSEDSTGKEVDETAGYVAVQLNEIELISDSGSNSSSDMEHENWTFNPKKGGLGDIHRKVRTLPRGERGQS